MNPKLKLSNLQIFAVIVWLLAIGVLTNGAYKDYINLNLDLPEYLKGIGVITAICLLAWGLPIPGKSSYPKPFEVGKNEKNPWNVNPWLAWFIAGSAFLFWVGASLTGRFYAGGFSAVGIWAIVLVSLWSGNRLVKRKKA